MGQRDFSGSSIADGICGTRNVDAKSSYSRSMVLVLVEVASLGTRREVHGRNLARELFGGVLEDNAGVLKFAAHRVVPA